MKQRIRNSLGNYFKDIWLSKNKRFTVLAYLFLPTIIVYINEALSRKSAIDALLFMFTDSYVFLVNVLIVAMFFSATLLMKKRIAGIAIMTILWLALGIANFVITSNRVTPFTFVDFFNIDSAIGVINKYVTFLGICLIIGGLALAIVVLIYIYRKVPKYAEKINYIKNAFIFAVVIGITFGAISIGLRIGVLSTNFPNLTIAFDTYGFEYCFSNSVVNMGIKEPEDYSVKTIEDIVAKLNAKEETKPKDENDLPNILFLQLESFFDVKHVKGWEYSTDPVPNFTKMKEEFPSGYFNVHNVGYGTANTEFEIMTGMNLDDFGPGEFPFKTILKSRNCESICYDLKNYDYSCHAIHNNTGVFYSRNVIFSQLGYDTFTSIEYMNDVELTPMEWAKDNVLTKEIMQTLESTDGRDYIYTISVQGHGSYPSNVELENKKITVSGIGEEDRLATVEYYVNQIYEMDEFIGELTKALSEYKEDVILVMYGDHLPTLDLTEDILDNESLYQTEYIIWNNMNIDMKDEDIEAYQISSKIMDYLDIQTGVINKFHQMFKGTDEYNKMLKLIEYDILYGDLLVYGGENPYIATELKMGIYDIKINDVYKQKDPSDINSKVVSISTEDEIEGLEERKPEDYVIIKGEHFTPYSIVFINNEEYVTEMLDENTLRVYYPELIGLDSFVVSQKYNSNILSKTTEFIYFSNEDGEEETLEVSE